MGLQSSRKEVIHIAKEKPGVMMYWEMVDVLESLLEGQAKIMLQAIRHYSQYGEAPDFDGDALLTTLWMLVKPKIDADSLRYERIIEQKRQAGKASAAKRLSEANECQQPLTGADGCQRIQPTTTATATPTATASTPTIEGIRDNVERDNGLTLASQPDNHISTPDDPDFEIKRTEAMKRLAAWGGDQRGL